MLKDAYDAKNGKRDELWQIHKISSMTEQEAQKKTVKLVEEISGKPVIIQAEPSLTFHATIKIADGNAPAHILLYKPQFEPELPYLACFQCGFAIRSFQLPAAERFDLASTSTAHAHVGRLILEHFRKKKRSLPSSVTEQLKQQLTNGLGTQLRSMPVGMRVDTWIHKQYPSLHQMQRTAAIRQVNEGAAALAPSVREISPRKVFNASVSMNAAFAMYWSQLWDDETVVTPYKASGHIKNGKTLLAILDEVPPAPACDRELIMAWMKELEIGTWYKIVPRK